MASRGILAYGAYLPFQRLDRKSIAASLGAGGGKGTRTVASYDEDTTSLGVEAARRALRALPAGAPRPTALYFATSDPASSLCLLRTKTPLELRFTTCPAKCLRSKSMDTGISDGNRVITRCAEGCASLGRAAQRETSASMRSPTPKMRSMMSSQNSSAPPSSRTRATVEAGGCSSGR